MHRSRRRIRAGARRKTPIISQEREYIAFAAGSQPRRPARCREPGSVKNEEERGFTAEDAENAEKRRRKDARITMDDG